jgi:hypothetical protein
MKWAGKPAGRLQPQYLRADDRFGSLAYAPAILYPALCSNDL